MNPTPVEFPQSNPDCCLNLIGAAEARGVLLGNFLGGCLHAERALEVDAARVRLFEALLARHAPEWLEEVCGFARAASIPVENLLLANCRPQAPNQFYLGGCTSFLIVGDASADGHPLLMKIRDEAPHPQYWARSGGDDRQCLFGTNSGNLGWAHFSNSHGLAGGTNTGSPITGLPANPALSDCHVLRFVAERAKDCHEALEVLGDVLARGICGTAGYKKGVVFLFADVAGRGLVVELCPDRMVHRFVGSGSWVYANHFLLEESRSFTDFSRYAEIPLQSSHTRYKRGLELIGQAGGRISVDCLKSISRDKQNGHFAICNDSDAFPWRTLSSFIHHLHPQAPVVHVCNGSPSKAEYRQEAIPLACPPQPAAGATP